MHQIFRRLYLKVFLWFWLTLVATLALLYVLSNVSLSALSTDDLQGPELRNLERLATAIERTAKRSGADIDNLINSPRLTRSRQLYLISLTDGAVLSNLSDERLRTFSALQLVDASAPQRIFHEAFHALGPIKVSDSTNQYLLYDIRPVRPLPLALRIKLIPVWIKLITALLASLLLSVLFTQNLIKPITGIADSAKAIGQGKLKQRAPASNRQDELGDLTREFNAMANQLEQLVEGQRSILSDISHELRSPLTRLTLACSIAQESDNVSEKQTQLTRIEKEAHQLNSMIEQILTLSKLENGRQAVTLQTQPLEPLLTAIIDDAVFEARSCNKRIESPKVLPSVDLKMDAALLASAIENVMRNAIHYAKYCVSFEMQTTSKLVILRISDDGDGVDEAALAQLTQPFYRVDSARSREQGGTGLGLAIAAKAVQAHSGTIRFYNNENGGLTAEIILQREAEASRG